MHKSNILIAALLTGAFASENPFVIEKNIQKIEQEESLLLQALAKEQKRLEREENDLSEESISKAKASDAGPEESRTPLEMEIAQEPEVQETNKEVEKNNFKEVATSKEEIEEPITIREVTKKVEIEAASKPEANKVQPSEEKQIEDVDAKNKKLEEKLEANETKPAIVDEVSAQPIAEANSSAESNTTFEQELQEAIKSVQD